jgi:hypothetical protein
MDRLHYRYYSKVLQAKQHLANLLKVGLQVRLIKDGLTYYPSAEHQLAMLW